MIHRYLEIIDRANHGEKVSKNEWDQNRVMMTVLDLVQQYELSWDKNCILPVDTAMIDRLFAAALALVEKIGVLCAPQNRVIRFSAEELTDGLHRMPQTLVMGAGKDARTLYARKVMDSRLPLVWAGNPGCPTPEELFVPTVMSLSLIHI